MARAPRLSLCLITRDEAGRLPACLAAVAGFVDEIVVCDTGSVDDTVAIAKAAGARVVHFPWIGDFSAARNAALDAATGDWILSLDADEQIAPGGGPLLRAFIADPTVDCGFLPLYDANRLEASPAEVVSGAATDYPPTLLPRLFRRTPDLRWEGEIHENMDAWLAVPGRRARGVMARIAHYGGIPALRHQQGKTRRNVELLERLIAARPRDVRLRGFLLYEVAADMPISALQAALAEAFAILVEEAPGLTPVNRQGLAEKVGGLYALVAYAIGDHATGDRVLGQCEAWGCDHPNLWWCAGVRAEACGDLDAAAAAWLRCLQDDRLWSVTILAGVNSWRSQLRLGLLHLRRGEAAPALARLEQAIGAPPPFGDEAIRGQAAALSLLGRPREALVAIKPALTANHPEGWLIAAAAVAQMGGRSQARDWLGKVAGRAVGPHLGLLLSRLEAALAAPPVSPRS